MDNYNDFFPYQGIFGHFFSKSTQDPLSFLHIFPTIPYPKPAAQNSLGKLTLLFRKFCLFNIFTIGSHLVSEFLIYSAYHAPSMDLLCIPGDCRRNPPLRAIQIYSRETVAPSVNPGQPRTIQTRNISSQHGTCEKLTGRK